VNDWADDNFDHTGLGFIGGASLTVSHEVHPIAAASLPTFGRAAFWGSKWEAFVRENAGRWTAAYAQCNSFPYENTYLDLDAARKEAVSNAFLSEMSNLKWLVPNSETLERSLQRR
jgi:gluconate 2-dehydrogenase alpha chain